MAGRMAFSSNLAMSFTKQELVKAQSLDETCFCFLEDKSGEPAFEVYLYELSALYPIDLIPTWLTFDDPDLDKFT